MTAKEKAQELINKFEKHNEDNDAHWAIGTGKDCALICVDEILNAKPGFGGSDYWNYWKEVKQEIEKL